MKDIKDFLREKVKKNSNNNCQERYKNLPEIEKKLLEYRKRYYKMRKNAVL